MIQIKSIEQLKTLTTGSIKSFRMYLKGGFYSRKEICFADKKFSIINCIDNSEQRLTEAELSNNKITLIGKAIKSGAFFYEN